MEDFFFKSSDLLLSSSLSSLPLFLALLQSCPLCLPEHTPFPSSMGLLPEVDVSSFLCILSILRILFLASFFSLPLALSLTTFFPCWAPFLCPSLSIFGDPLCPHLFFSALVWPVSLFPLPLNESFSSFHLVHCYLHLV